MTSVELPYVPILLNKTFTTALRDTGAEKSFISVKVYRKYFSYRPRQKTKDRVVVAQGAPCSHLGRVELQIRIREFQKPWEFHILDNMQYQCILGIDFMKASRLTLDFDQKSLIIPDNQIKQLSNFSEQFNLFTDASGVGIGAVLQQNQKPIAFASRSLNKAERNYTVTKRECLAVIWALNKFKTYFGPLPVKVITDHAALTKLTNGKNLSSRMIRWALKLSEFNIEWEHKSGVQNVVADLLSRNPVDSIEGSQISCAALRALAINSREQFIREQREDPELGHIYRYLENPDDGSVNATVCEAGRLMPIVSKYPNEIVTLDLLGPYPASQPERYKFILVISDHFTKWCELIPLRKASAQAIANALFDNYIARYGVPISLISDNGPQFISDVFEHLSHRLDIKHMKTVTYRP
ncbi:retrovirus-related Pol polyprotein from transposon opus [Trichonephila clavipes]|nr:retrovirus-related Pol polyprotein from transposon opus [Trichonephila clavipes]